MVETIFHLSRGAKSPVWASPRMCVVEALVPSACLFKCQSGCGPVLENKHRPYLQPHQLADVFHRRTAIRNHLVVVFLEIEIFAELFLRGRTKVEMFADAYEISRQLRRCQPCAFPFEGGLALFLEGPFR